MSRRKRNIYDLELLNVILKSDPESLLKKYIGKEIGESLSFEISMALWLAVTKKN